VWVKGRRGITWRIAIRHFILAKKFCLPGSRYGLSLFRGVQLYRDKWKEIEWGVVRGKGGRPGKTQSLGDNSKIRRLSDLHGAHQA